MYWCIWYFLLLNFNCHSVTATDITEQVFGNDIELLPAAFGDFNSDEVTDLFVLRNNSRTIEIFLGSNEVTPLLKASNLKCSFNASYIINVVPGDFDGDALMDILVVTKNSTKQNILGVHILKGGRTYLNCTYDEQKPLLYVHGEPLAIDCNNDFIIDLFGVNSDGQQGIWLFENSKPSFQIFNSTGKIRDPHSNSYLDLTGDNTADLFLTLQKEMSYYFEIWRGVPKETHFTFYNRIPAPKFTTRKLGQSLFLDLELKGKMDLLVPVLVKTNPKILVFSQEKWRDLNVNFRNKDKLWYFLEAQSPFSKAVTLRGGDYNMDGYPDILATLTEGTLRRTFLLENVPCRLNCGNFSRSFQVRWEGILNDNDTVSGIFYDIYQDGILDVILLRQLANGTYRVAAIKNNLDYDANFIKVMILTGLRHKNSSKNAFGTNLPGPRVAYRTVDQDGFLRTGLSAQIPQSAHYSLHLPYIMFALGRTPNFVDNITVGFAGEYRDLPQVIPNSQMVIIPVQIDNPARWKVQLFVTPSKIIVLSGAALVGTCFFILLIIFYLHWKEKKLDRIERLQEAHRFNFDAM